MTLLLGRLFYFHRSYCIRIKRRIISTDAPVLGSVSRPGWMLTIGVTDGLFVSVGVGDGVNVGKGVQVKVGEFSTVGEIVTDGVIVGKVGVEVGVKVFSDVLVHVSVIVG